VQLARAYYESTRSTGASEHALFWQDPVRTYAEALEMAALIEEDHGRRHAADSLFDHALALIEPEAFEETRYAINLSYATVLEARGDLRNAARFYRVAATLNPRGSRRGT
jgi:hypothetical protein